MLSLDPTASFALCIEFKGVALMEPLPGVLLMMFSKLVAPVISTGVLLLLGVGALTATELCKLAVPTGVWLLHVIPVSQLGIFTEMLPPVVLLSSGD